MDHAKLRMSDYRISESEVEEVVKNPEKLFLDLKTGRIIAIRKWMDKHLVVVFEKNDLIVIVTVFPTSKVNKVVEKRIEKGRWLEL
jgi:hypothetical protein